METSVSFITSVFLSITNLYVFVDYVNEDSPTGSEDEEPFEPDLQWADFENYPDESGRCKDLLRGGEFGTFSFQNQGFDRYELIDKKTKLGNSPLFAGSKCTVSEFSKGLLFLRQKFHRQMGDELMAGISGLVASCLPDPNVFDEYSKKCCRGSKTKYHMNKFIFEASGLSGEKALVSGRVDICDNGCFPFCGESADIFICPVCNTPRYTKCSISCIDEDSSLLKCSHPRSGRRHMYYNTIRDRVIRLLDSDVGRLFSYPLDRRPCEDNYVDDIYDGTAWKGLQSLLENDEELIGIQMCTDGADMYNFSGRYP